MTDVLVRCGEKEILFGKRRQDFAGYSAELASENGNYTVKTYGDSGLISAPCEVLCGAGKVLWERGVKQCPLSILDQVTGESHLLMASLCGEKVTAVTVGAGTVEFDPKSLPLRFEKPVIHNRVTLPGSKPFYLTALKFGAPYAVIFVETAGDCTVFSRGREISKMSLFPHGAEVVFCYLRGESEMHLKPLHRDGSTSLLGADVCAALGAAVGAGLCLAERAVTVPQASGNLRAVCTKEREVFVTLPTS